MVSLHLISELFLIPFKAHLVPIEGKQRNKKTGWEKIKYYKTNKIKDNFKVNE